MMPNVSRLIIYYSGRKGMPRNYEGLASRTLDYVRIEGIFDVLDEYISLNFPAKTMLIWFERQQYFDRCLLKRYPQERQQVSSSTFQERNGPMVEYESFAMFRAREHTGCKCAINQ
jgi:hypothetical protein